MPGGKPVNVQGDGSHAIFSNTELMASYRLWHRLYATVGLNWYYRTSTYDRMMYFNEPINWGVSTPIIDSHQVGLHLMLTYAF